MSRIVGLIQSDSNVTPSSLAEGLLSSLPGKTVRTARFPSGVFGWKGWDRGPAGGVHSEDYICAAIDGRILNAAELSQGLSIRGGDAELLVALYRRHGFRGALERIVGDFSAALMDGKEATLWLGRDRFGVKPLYYVASKDKTFAFASQPRALFSVSGVSTRPNRGFVARFASMHYRTFDNDPEASPYADISQLPAAHFITVKRGEASRPIRYWSLDEQPEWNDSEDCLAERYRDLLFKAVDRRVSAVERPAFTLSGGLDSSSVLCCAAITQDKKQYAVSSVYVDATFDERDEIRDVVVEKVSQWDAVEIPNEINLFDIVSRMVRVHDEPVATATWLSHFLLSDKVASSGFTALFGGLGGDELNAGEYEYFPMYFADLAAQGQTRLLEEEIAAWAHHHDHPIYQKNRQTAEAMMARMTDPKRAGVCLPDHQRLMRYANAVKVDYFNLSSFKPVMDTPFKSYLKNRTYQDMFRETLPCCLRAEDRQCTAAGLEHFDPFLDHELVEFMYRVPGHMKIRGGTTKQLLRHAMRGILPEVTRTRIKKTGWNAPAHRWFNGAALESLKDIVASQRFRQHGIYDPDKVLAIIDDHVRIVETGVMAENHMMFLWQLLNMSLWLESLDEYEG